jgi:hypothetical protein
MSIDDTTKRDAFRRGYNLRKAKEHTSYVEGDIRYREYTTERYARNIYFQQAE